MHIERWGQYGSGFRSYGSGTGVIVFGQMPGESGFDRDLDCGQGQEGAATWGCLEISEGSDPFVFIFRSFLVIFWGIERHGGCAI